MNRPNIRIVKGDITFVDADVIVNSANETLLGDDGVDGAIHIAAGPELREYCSRIGGCGVGEAVVTPSFKLPHSHIIHTVGPQYGNEGGKERALLERCYRECLRLADELGAVSLAFPSISTGQYGYPINEASLVVLEVINEYQRNNPNGVKEVILVFYDSSEFNDSEINEIAEYKKAANKLGLKLQIQ